MSFSVTREGIPTDHLASIRDRVAKAAKRAQKLGLDAPRMVSGEPRLIPDPSFIGHREDAPLIRVADVTLTGPERLGLAGWSLLGRIDILEDGTPLIARTPGTEAIELPAITDPFACDHCKLSRRRISTFLVSGPAGIAQVGRNCLRDFLGADPEGLLWWSSWIRETSEWMGEQGGGERLTPVLSILRLASRLASRGGYISKAKAEEWRKPSTATTVDDWLWLRSKDAKERGRIDRERLAELERDYPDDDAAQALLDLTLETIPTSGDNEWASNVRLLTGQTAVAHKHLGIVASAVVMGLKAQGPREAKETITSVHVGEVGKLVELRGEVTLARPFDSDYGTRMLIKLRIAPEGADVLWWASKWLPVKVGDTASIRGTVKAHDIDSYTHRPVTILTRATLSQ